MNAARCPVNFRLFASLAMEKRSNREQVSDWALIEKWFTAFLQLRILNLWRISDRFGNFPVELKAETWYNSS